mmetsp:Transcript_11410/g.28839  ORF Transcript_11410/g.28839 Transcript_11410/m.28839 type:complete len:81 (+) Transcript_11410:1202-1444(+)
MVSKTTKNHAKPSVGDNNTPVSFQLDCVRQFSSSIPFAVFAVFLISNSEINRDYSATKKPERTWFPYVAKCLMSRNRDIL